MKQILTLFFSLLVIPLSFGATTKVQIGELYYNLDSDTKTAEVTYEVYYSSNNYKDLTSVTIPAEVEYQGYIYSVTSIGKYAFCYCSGLTKVMIPSSVSSIGTSAFDGCSGLTRVEITDLESWCKIKFSSYDSNPLYYAHHLYLNGNEVKDLDIPNSITSIGNYAFEKCKGLTSVTIPNSVTEIGDDAFSDCSGLTNVSMGNSVTSIGDYAFYGCNGLTKVEISDLENWCKIKFTGLSANPFYYANSLYLNGKEVKDLVIPNSVTSIGDLAFFNCDGLTSVTIPNSVTSIGNEAFRSCTGLTSVIIPNSVTSIGIRVFDYCSGLIKSAYPSTIRNPFSNGVYVQYPAEGAIIEDGFVYGPNKSTIFFAPLDLQGEFSFPASVTSIGDNAFRNCEGLTSVTIPNSVTKIGDNAFRNCEGLTSVTIPNSVTKIGDDAFRDCTGFTEVRIPNSVTSIGANAFRDCNLMEITIPENVSFIGRNAFFCQGDLETVNYNAKDCIFDNYDEGNNYFYYTFPRSTSYLRIGDKVEKLPTYFAVGLNNIDVIVIPNSVTVIGPNAFYDCDGLTKVEITDLEAWCKIRFDNGSSNPLNYAHHLYLNGNEVKDLVIPSSITSIGDFAFEYCEDLTSVTIPNSVTSIGWAAFAACSGLTNVTIPNSVTSINGWAFFNCNGLTDITIPDSVIGIGVGAFQECSGLKSVTIGNSVISIGQQSFYNCSGLTSVTIGNSVTSIGAYAFEDCVCLKSIMIPNSVTSIGYAAFSNCSGLTSVTIGNSVTSILDEAFSGCSGLTSVIIPNSVTEIGNRAFSGCSGLTSVIILNSVTEIGNRAFENCINLIKSAYPSSISDPFPYGVSIQYPANDSLLENGWIYNKDKTAIYFAPLALSGKYDILNEVTEIGYAAFANCSGLTEVSLGVNMSSIGENAFADTSLETVNNYAYYPPTLFANTFDNAMYMTLHVLKGRRDIYSRYDYWRNFGEIIDDLDADDYGTSGVESISDYFTGDNEEWFDVYDLTGRMIMRKASKQELESLKQGVYIVNGRKVVVK